MSAFELILRFPRGSVLIGGHAPVPDGVHAVHARLVDGQPFLPASAIRGALRESLEGLLRAENEPACEGGDGKQPSDGPAAEAWSGPCRLDGGRPCRACRLFGGGRSVLPPGERMFSGLVLGEAIAVEASADRNRNPPLDRQVDWQSRFAVGIDRRRRSAADKMLARRLVPEPGLVFRATGRLTTANDTLRTDLEAAVRATTHIGSGRSAGLARVEMEIRWVEQVTAIDPLPPGDSVELAVELAAPASLGAPVAMRNFHDTRRCIPGSALRGAIGFALAEALDDPADPDFQALVDPDTGAVFDFLHPVDDVAAHGLSGDWPITAQQCKTNPSHGVIDTLLQRIAVRCVSGVADVPRLDPRCACPTCHGALGGTVGSRRARKAPGVQIVTRVSMDRRRSSARDKALFSYAQVVRGVRFVGAIRSIPERARGHLARALALPLSVGRARSLGWGALRILTVVAPQVRENLEERGRSFDAALSAHLSEAGLRTDRVGRLAPFTLLSPLVIEPEDDGRVALSSALGIPMTWFMVARRFELEGRWDQRSGEQVVRVARAGSVFVAELPDGYHWREFLAPLSRLEARGAGRWTRMGFGRVICFDPLICQGANKP